MHGSRTARIAAAAIVAAVLACSDDLTDPASINAFSANLNGASERPTAVSTNAAATSDMTVNGATLTYDVDITSAISNVTQAHIHTGGPTATGPVAVWFCGTASNPGPSGTPTCGSGAVGSLVSSTAAVDAATVNSMRGFGAYVNVHTTANPGGEIRGNIVGVY